MALKLVTHMYVGQHRAKVYRDTEWDEFRTKFYNHVEYLGESCDAHTDDKEDALGTARAELWRLAELVEVRAALQEFRDTHGRNWRAFLHGLWMSGQDTGLLRQARNYLGPEWLNHPQGAVASL